MALYKTTSEIPRDAVKIDEQEAIKYQWDIIQHWKPPSEVWPLKYGVTILGASTALQAIFVNMHYRRKLGLFNIGVFSTYLPNVAIPSVVGPLFHSELIVKDILIQKTPCPLCIELRSAAFHTFFSTLYPIILSPISNFIFAHRYYTYMIPPIQKPGEVLKLFVNLTRPVGNTLFTSFMIQAFIAIAVTYYEAHTLATVNSKLMEVEERICQETS